MQLNLGKTGFKAALMLNGHGVCKYVKHAWDGAGVRVAADGGWKKVAAEGMKDPTHVVGDMDSGGCGASGVVVRVPRQDNTDFMKCLDFLEKEGITGDLPVGFALGGRLDHLMTNLRSLLHTPTIRPILFDSTNMATLLYPGTTTITYTPLYTTKGIGIIPLTPSPTHLSTPPRASASYPLRRRPWSPPPVSNGTSTNRRSGTSHTRLGRPATTARTLDPT
eukprot:TRINITY_DN15629_c0_g1_i1.p1 TRINITY_DN15629_c0_g1~~TRINITY_DN15629_c0_g1_i1.p1  ORF type:complete len:221 (+),score=26.36 TRINITY_DN15629_c0_g1_i1:602-1264(+)